jgi:hypothetical protein
MYKKGLALAIIVLFIGVSIMPMAGSIPRGKHFKTEIQFEEYSSEDISESNTPIIPIFKPPDTGAVCGYVTDKFTSEPIENARVYLCFDTMHINTTYTNDSGFYLMNSPDGQINLLVEASGYRWDYPFHCIVEENETTWENISKIPYPPFNSIVCGYVTDELTNESIENVYCTFYWTYYGVNCEIGTETDSDGFYKINLPAIEDIIFIL